MRSQNWLVAPRNITLFPLAGIITLTFLVFLLSLFLALDPQRLAQMETSVSFRIFCAIVGVVSAPTGIYLAIGMFWYWATLDRSSKLHKTIWFLLFLTTGFVALAAYSILVYRRQAKFGADV